MNSSEKQFQRSKLTTIDVVKTTSAAIRATTMYNLFSVCNLEASSPLLITQDNNEAAWLYCYYNLLSPTSVLKLGSETVYI